MSALPPVAGALSIQLRWDIGGDEPATTKFFEGYSAGPPDAIDVAAFATTVRESVNTNLRSLFVSSVSLIETVVTDLSADDAARGIDTTAVVGDRTGSQLTAAVSALVNYIIDRRYRGGKPRSYFPFGADDDLATMKAWDSSLQTAVDTGVTNFMASLSGVTIGSAVTSGHINISYFSGSEVVISPTTGRARNVPKQRTTPRIDPVVALAMSLVPGSQRRRYQR